MTNVNAAADSTQAAGKNESPPPLAADALHGGSKVYMSGPLFLSSKGIGWTSWKKRWFILTQTSLVFYRSDPNAAPQKGGEVNLTLGGIDLSSSGSVVVKEDKKLITVSFADGRDGRTFTLKAEALEDLYKWKAALEDALANAPSASPVTSQNGASRNEQSISDDGSSEQSKDKQTNKSSVLGRPILLALEDTDGTPSFLEKALRFVEEHGVKTEGILRQAADVELVERRILEYERGKNEFSPDEDAHVIGDCIKYILRELPSSPVPASCCKALVEAQRTERNLRVNAMQSAICETFPEPNRRLLQRMLEMMETVASNKNVNRMSVSAVAACMAPLLLRPLLAGECDNDNNINMGSDGSAQLLQAAAAANHAQAIVITLLDEYDNIFGDPDATSYMDSEDSEMESDEFSDDESYDDEDEDDYLTEGSDYDDEDERESRATNSDIGENQSDEQVSGSQSSRSDSSHVYDSSEANQSSPSSPDDISNPDAGRARRHAVWGRAPGKKNLAKKSTRASLDDEAESQKLDHAKTDSQTGIPNEALMKSLLQDIIQKRKHDLHERRLHLEKDVVMLQEQLQKEMDLRKVLEAGLRNSQQPLPVSSLINEKMKAKLEAIARAEADVIILKRKVNDLELQLHEQREQNSTIGYDTGKEIHQNLDYQQRLKANSMDGGALTMSNSLENLSMSKDESHSDIDKMKESPSLPNLPLTQYQQTDAAQNPKLLSVVNMATSTLESNKFGTPPRKASLKMEGAAPGTGSGSALTKLTNRLNFLKERRSQIANELQNMNRGRNISRQTENRKQSTTASEPPQSPDSSNKQQESKAGPSEKGHESENRNQHSSPTAHHLSQNTDRGKKSKKPQSLDKRKI